MTGYIGKTTRSTREVAGAGTQAERDDMMGPMDGVVVSYDAARGVGNIQPLQKKILADGETLDYPVLIDVPIEQIRTSSSGLTMPGIEGAKVRLTPQMRSTENYHANGDGTPSDARTFHLSDMTASLIGGDSLSEPLKNVDPDNIHLRADAEGKFGLRASPDGKFKIDGAEGDIFDLLAQAIRLIAEDQLLINYGSSKGTGHQLQNRDALMVIASKLEGMKIT